MARKDRPTHTLRAHNTPPRTPETSAQIAKRACGRSLPETHDDFEIVVDDASSRVSELAAADLIGEHPFITDGSVDWRSWRRAGKAALDVSNQDALDELGFQGFHRNLLAYIKHAIMTQVPAPLREIIHTNINWPELHRDYIAMDPETRTQRKLLWLEHNGQIAVFEFAWRPRPEK